jgi:catechol 2,3-dioxygenase-like lactoylglutathione lyase family enzyme
MLDHVTFPVSDVDAAVRRYTAALAPLGYKIVMDFTQAQIPGLPHPRFVGLGAQGKPDFWLRPAGGPVDATHIAFRVRDRDSVDAFHAAALAAGLRDDGVPGVRAHYHPTYYAAFVRDADGHSLEVVCHEAPAERRTAAKRQQKPASRRAAKKPPARRGGKRRR